MKMPNTRLTALLLAGAGLALSAGIVLLGSGVAHARAARARMEYWQNTYTVIADARSEIETLEARQSLLAHDRAKTDTLASLHETFFPGQVPEFVRREPAADTPAGRLRRWEWLIDDAPAEAVLAFAAACESARPPWRVESLRLTAVPGSEGRIRGGIVFLGVER